MREYKFLQTICEDGRPTDCVPFINRFPPLALQCLEIVCPSPIAIRAPLFCRLRTTSSFSQSLSESDRAKSRFGPFLRGVEKSAARAARSIMALLPFLLPN